MNRKHAMTYAALVIVATAAIAQGEMVAGTVPAALSLTKGKITGVAANAAAIGEDCSLDPAIYVFDAAEAADFSAAKLGDPVYVASSTTVTQDSSVSKVVAGVFAGIVPEGILVDTHPAAIAAGYASIVAADAATAAGAAATAAAAAQTTANNAIPTAQKGVANGVATLDAGVKIPASQIPS